MFYFLSSFSIEQLLEQNNLSQWKDCLVMSSVLPTEKRFRALENASFQAAGFSGTIAMNDPLGQKLESVSPENPKKHLPSPALW